jgi:mannan endo-1,4-beta-mannosidase
MIHTKTFSIAILIGCTSFYTYFSATRYDKDGAVDGLNLKSTNEMNRSQDLCWSPRDEDDSKIHKNDYCFYSNTNRGLVQNILCKMTENYQDNNHLSDEVSSWGNGINLQPSYYNNGSPVINWPLMKQQVKIKTLRIEIEPDKVAQATVWISQAKENGYHIICTYHKATILGSNDPEEVIAAAKWWKLNYNLLGGGFTINLINEWGNHDIGASDFARAYNSAITIVRSVYNGRIIIDIPGWGQETFTALQAVTISDPKITDDNIALSCHIYPLNWNKGRNHVFQKYDLDDLTKTGKPCLIGEFGNSPTGSCDWSGCVDYAKSKGWPILGWCWNGDGGTMNMVAPSWECDPQANSFSLSPYFSTIYDKL